MNNKTFIPVAMCCLSGNEKKYVNECLDSTWISSAGTFVTRFEEAFAAFCGTRFALATCNGTTALHLALMGLGLEPADEVIVPTVTFIATANAVHYTQAKPVLVDCDPDTWNMRPEDVAAKITAKTRGIIPVHLYGHPVDMDPLMDLAKKHGLFVLEDAAEAHGAYYKERPVGSIGHVGVFSLFGNKIITTGEGGMIVTDDEALYRRMLLLRGQGMSPDRRYWFPIVGYNYRMTNVAAAIGLAQIEKVEEHLAERQRVADGYDQRLKHLPSSKLKLPITRSWAKHAYWMYTVCLGEEVGPSRDTVIQKLREAGIETRPVFYPLHVMPPYAEDPAGYPVSTHYTSLGINLPTHALLSDDDLDRICDILIQVIS